MKKCSFCLTFLILLLFLFANSLLSTFSPYPLSFSLPYLFFSPYPLHTFSTLLSLLPPLLCLPFLPPLSLPALFSLCIFSTPLFLAPSPLSPFFPALLSTLSFSLPSFFLSTLSLLFSLPSLVHSPFSSTLPTLPAPSLFFPCRFSTPFFLSPYPLSPLLPVLSLLFPLFFSLACFFLPTLSLSSLHQPSPYPLSPPLSTFLCALSHTPYSIYLLSLQFLYLLSLPPHYTLFLFLPTLLSALSFPFFLFTLSTFSTYPPFLSFSLPSLITFSFYPSLFFSSYPLTTPPIFSPYSFSTFSRYPFFFFTHYLLSPQCRSVSFSLL